MIKVCQYCGKEYKTYNSKSKYCSQKCVGLSQRIGKIIKCAYCEKEIFSPQSNHKKYCSIECYYKDINAQVTHTTKCLNCGKEFSYPSYRELKYCSKECYQEHRRNRTDKNEIKIEKDYAIIFIKSKYFGKTYECLIDLENLDLIKQYKWSIDGNLYVYNGRIGKLHQLILKPKNGYNIDHINRNTLDNRKINLRYATPSQNGCNRSLRKNNKTGYRGVSIKGNKYQATLRNKFLGYYDTPEKAFEARLKAEEKDINSNFFPI